MQRVNPTWQKSMPKGEHKCEYCHQTKECAFIVDPYMLEIYNQSFERETCAYCYQNRVNDI